MLDEPQTAHVNETNEITLILRFMGQAKVLVFSDAHTRLSTHSMLSSTECCFWSAGQEEGKVKEEEQEEQEK